MLLRFSSQIKYEKYELIIETFILNDKYIILVLFIIPLGSHINVSVINQISVYY